MSEPDQLTNVTFTTQPVTMPLTNKHARVGETKIIFEDGEAKHYDMELVTSIAVDGHELVINPDHADDIDSMEFKNEDAVHREMEMSHSRALRLIEAFRTLRRGHDTGCHRFLTMVEGWEDDPGGATLNSGNGLLQDASQVQPGTPYRVLSFRDADDDGLSVNKTHSAIGGPKGQLLSVMGIGSALTFMHYDDTKEVYGFDGTAQLARAYDPGVAAQYPLTIVPEVEGNPASVHATHSDHQ